MDEFLKYKDNIYTHITNCFSAVAIFDLQGSSDNSMYVFSLHNLLIIRMIEIEKKLEAINKNISILNSNNYNDKDIENEKKSLYSFFASKTKETLSEVLIECKNSFLNLNSKQVRNFNL